MTGARRLMAQLRVLMAGTAEGGAVMRDLTQLVAAELVAEVCTIYAMRPGDLLELTATFGLNPDAVGRTRLRVGEGIVGIAAATGSVQNLPDAQNHPAFAYRPETGEDPYASLLAVPVRRGGRTLGVIAVQNRAPRLYQDDECELLETVAMLLGELLAGAGATDGAEQGLAATFARVFPGNGLAPGIAIGPVVLHGMGAPIRRLLAEDPGAELKRLALAGASMRQSLEDLIETRMPDGDGPRAVLEATRLVSRDGGWMGRVREAIAGGLTAEAAVHRVTNEVRSRMRRISDPYLRERLADLEDLAGRLLAALDGEAAVAIPPGAILLARRLGPAQLLEWHARGIAGVLIEEGSAGGHAAILARALGLPALGGGRGVLEAVEEGDTAVLDADEGQLILRPDSEVRATYDRALLVRQAAERGYAAQRDKPARTADGVDLRLMLNVGLALEMEQLEATGAAGIGLFRTEIAMLARGSIADVAGAGGDVCAGAGRGGGAAGAVPHAGSGRGQAAAGCGAAGGGEPGDGVAVAADRTRPAVAAAAAVAGAAAGGRGASAVGDVPDGGDCGGVPRGQGAAAGGGGKGAAGAGAAGGGVDDRGSGAAVPVAGADAGGRLRVDRVERPDAVPVCGGPGDAGAGGAL